jgi:hypothetical protein
MIARLYEKKDVKEFMQKDYNIFVLPRQKLGKMYRNT